MKKNIYIYVCVCVCVYIYLSDFDVQQKLTQYCKSTVFHENKF